MIVPQNTGPEVFQALVIHVSESSDIELRLSFNISPKPLVVGTEFGAKLSKIFEDRHNMMVLSKEECGIPWSGAYDCSTCRTVEVWPYKNNTLGIILRAPTMSGTATYDYHTGKELDDDDMAEWPDEWW